VDATSRPAVAWRVLRDGEPTAVTLHLADDSEAEQVKVAALVCAAARRAGVELEPVWPDDLGPVERPHAA
jgi:hypothetical protein